MVFSSSYGHSNAAEPNGCHSGSAIFREVIGGSGSDRDWRCDVRVGLVIFEQEIVSFIIEQPLSAILNDEARQSARLAAQLQPRLFEMVGVEMAIAPGPHEHARR